MTVSPILLVFISIMRRSLRNLMATKIGRRIRRDMPALEAVERIYRGPRHSCRYIDKSGASLNNRERVNAVTQIIQ
jgi:hypothetical protein